MVNFRFLKWVTLSLVALFWVVACAPSGNFANNNTPQTQPITVGTNSWSGYSGHHVAMEKGFYEKAGLKVQDTMFPTDTDQITAFTSGKIDLAWIPSASVVQMLGKDPNAKIIFLIDYSNGADGILGRGIKRAADLKGKTVARENVLFEKILLQAYLQKASLSEADVVIRDLPSADAATAFSAKKVDAAVTYEPYLSKAAKEGGGEIVFSTRDTPLIADVIVARQSLLNSRRADLVAYLKAANQGIRLIKSGDADALTVAAKKIGIKPEELNEQLKGVTLFDAQDNKVKGFDPENPASLIKNLTLTTKAAYEFKFVPQQMDVKSLYDPSLVKELGAG